jgi:hypothetical protein
VGKAKALFAKLFGKKEDKEDERTDEQKKADLHKAVAAGTALLKQDKLSGAQIQTKLRDLRSEYRLRALEVIKDNQNNKTETDHLRAEINPVEEGEQVSRDLTGESQMVVSITSQIGAPQPRAGYEKDLPSTGQMQPGAEAPHQRAHSQGPGTGRESRAGIRRAPVFVNQILQNHGIEAFIRGLVDKIKNDPNTTMSLKTETRTIRSTLRLQSIIYQIDAEVDGKTKTVLIATITVSGSRVAPTASASIDYVGASFAGFLVSAAEEIFAARLEEDNT